MSLGAATSKILCKNALNELAAKPCFPCIIWSHWCLYLLFLPLKQLLSKLLFCVLRLSGLGSHSLNPSPSLIMLFRINICRYCCIFLLNLSRQLHFKATSGNYHPALPTAAFLTQDPALAWQVPDQRVLRCCFSRAPKLHWASTWRKISLMFGDLKAGYNSAFKQWFSTAHRWLCGQGKGLTGISAGGTEALKHKWQQGYPFLSGVE